MPLSECNSLWNKGLCCLMSCCLSLEQKTVMPGWHHCLLFKGEALHSFSASLHSRMQGGGGFDAQ